MQTPTTRARLRWSGFASVAELTRRIERRQRICIALPASYHHALCARFAKPEALHGTLRVQGGRTLLSEIAAIPGLHDFADVADFADDPRLTVRVQSPPARVVIDFDERTQRA